MTDEKRVTGVQGDLSGGSDLKHAIGPELAGRWGSLPPRIRLQDTIAIQEVPPKPQVVGEPDDPFREVMKTPGA